MNYAATSSSLLIENPKTFRSWWTFVPVLPADRNDWRYHALKRQWADHTMNTLKMTKGGALKLGPRGFYVEAREDHISTCLFHIWAAFPDSAWVEILLDIWDIPHGHVHEARWSYSWEQKRNGSRRRDITDIVLGWRDEQGIAALIIEAKRRGGKLGKKDANGALQYLEMPSLRPIDRRWVAFLVDEADMTKFSAILPSNTRIATWQDMGRAQIRCIGHIGLPPRVQERMQSFVARHYGDFDIEFDEVLSAALRNENFTGTADRYRAIQELALPDTVKRFLLGSELTFCARSGVLPEPPFPWLNDEPTFLDIVEARAQSTEDREYPWWRVS